MTDEELKRLKAKAEEYNKQTLREQGETVDDEPQPISEEEMKRKVRGKRRKKKELTPEEEIVLAEMKEEARQKAYKVQSDWVRDRCKQYNLRFNIGKTRDAELIEWLENGLEEYGVLEELSESTGRTYSSGKKTTKDALGRTLSVYNNGKMEYIKQTLYADMKRRKKKAAKAKKD